MLKLSDELVQDIANNIDMEMICYLNIKTMEPTYVFPEKFSECLDEDLDEASEFVYEHKEDFIKIEKPDSHTSYKFMEAFIETITDDRIAERLSDAISFAKPFRNFKDILARYPDVQKEWYAFKNKKYIEYIKSEIVLHTEVRRGGE